MEKAETEMWLEVGEKVFWTLKILAAQLLTFVYAK